MLTRASAHPRSWVGAGGAESCAYPGPALTPSEPTGTMRGAEVPWPASYQLWKTAWGIMTTAFTISTAGQCGSGDPLFGDVTQNWGFPGSSQNQGALWALPGSEAGPHGRQEPWGVMAHLHALSMGRAQKALGRRDESETHSLDPATCESMAVMCREQNMGSEQMLCGRYTREIPAHQEVLTTWAGKSKPLNQPA